MNVAPAGPVLVSTVGIDTIVNGSSAVTPLYAAPTFVLSAWIMPLLANSAAALKFDFSPTPVNQQGFNLPPLPNGRWYDLSKINMQGAVGDGVQVIGFGQ